MLHHMIFYVMLHDIAVQGGSRGTHAKGTTTNREPEPSTEKGGNHELRIRSCVHICICVDFYIVSCIYIYMYTYFFVCVYAYHETIS